jgi:arsenical pump membrane protein
MAAAFAWRAPRALSFALVPWPLVLFVAGLFLTVGALQASGSAAVLSAVTGTGEDFPALLRVAAAGLAGSNVINNLPAYLALEPTAGTPARIAALLIGVNAGSIVLPWGSLATLLWHDRLASLGVDVRWGRFILLGCLVAPATVLLATLALALTAG